MIKVLIVDDSAVVRQVLSRELAKAGDIEVIGTAPDPFVARDKILQNRPDVMTLDIEMPRMDGLTFLRKIMQYYPIPTIIVSSLTSEGSAMAMEALEIGAIDVLAKPGSAYSVGDVSHILIDQIRAAAQIKFDKVGKIREIAGYRNMSQLPTEQGNEVSTAKSNSQFLVKHLPSSLTETTQKIVAIGASTGGTIALEYLLKSLPANCPGIVIVQHMPEQFTSSFAARLNTCCPMEVREAKNGDSILAGLALIAPGNYHTIVQRSGARYLVEVKTGSPVFHQRPSVEVMFQSVARFVGANAVGVILTGMGSDGSAGLLEIRQAGAATIAQDEATSVVWGMPGEAVRLGAAEHILPLQSIANMILKLARVAI